MKEDQKIVIYQTPDGKTQIDVRLENETVWLNVAQMASLFTKEESNVRRHVSNAFKDSELERDDNNVHFLHVNGVKKPVPFYSLDVIISVGYRVHSKRGTAFRIWARQIIKDYLVRGYAVNQRIHSEQIGSQSRLVARVTMFATGKVTNERWTCAEEGFVLVTTTNLSATLREPTLSSER